MKNKICALAAVGIFVFLFILCSRAGGILLEKSGIARVREVLGRTESVRDRGAVILDPGHGGADGGKEAINGAEEKNINLSIALMVEELLENEGTDVIMTRTEDGRLGSTQIADLRERVRVINESGAFFAVSIHQNSYHEEGVSGAQVFYYSDSKSGKQAAEILQKALEDAGLQNVRDSKANDTYYILKNTEIPVVIVECGFLSNKMEADKLSDIGYQREIAEAIADGIKKYKESAETDG